MSKFSDRIGVTKPKIAIQIGSMDSELKSRLWNAFSNLLTRAAPTWADNLSSEMLNFTLKLYHSFFKKPTDLVSSSYVETYNTIRKYFLTEAQWYDIYNLLEFAANNYENPNQVEGFISACNSILETELSGYRFIERQIVPMTSKNEIC
jgi:hypothetical protein